jgi:hypothetical protein
MHQHPATINHYAHAYEGNGVKTYIWEQQSEVTIDTQYPESPKVALVFSNGEELPVDLVYLGTIHGVDAWETQPPCTRTDLTDLRVITITKRCILRVNRGEL